MAGEQHHEPHRYRAALRVSSRSVRLSELALALGPPNARSHDIGDPRSQRSDSTWEHSAWTYAAGAGSADAPLEQLIGELVEFAESRAHALRQLRSQCEMDVFCGIISGDSAQGGFAFDPSLMRRLADLELEVIFDVY